MLEGLMQHDHPLTLQQVMWRMRHCHPDGEVVTLGESGKTRAVYADVCERVDRLCRGLEALGVEQSDRVGTLAWNTQQHLELYLAVPCMGAVLHTVNLRLSDEHLAFIINQAEDKVMFVDDSLVPTLERVANRLESVRRYVVIGDGDPGSLPGALRYEDLLAGQQPGYSYPVLDDRQAAGLCHTSGTTGNPKGVLYSHRSQLLHALVQCTADNWGLSIADRAMPLVPMFHASAWGIPHAACLVGADLIMPGRFVSPDRVARLIEEEAVTVSGAVPTVWSDLLRYADEHKPDLSSVRLLGSGGAATPLALMRDYEERHGVKLIQLWGLTETSPLASIAWPPPGAEGDEYWRYRDKTGRVLPLVEARIVSEDGEELPADGNATGEIELRGPFIASAYYKVPDSSDKFDDGWFRTGDIASMDELGYLKITDRAKDVIKSGGEWISSLDVEAALIDHPAVLEAAVIAKPDERWTERPLPCVVLREEGSASAEELRAHLAERLPKWWLPDEFAFIEEVPKTSTGKFDKKVLRERLREGKLEPRVAVHG